MFEISPVAPVLGKLEKLRKFLNDLLDAGFSVGLILNDIGQAERLNEILCEWQINSSIGGESAELSPGSVRLLVGDIGQGFVLREEKTAILSHSDIFLKRSERRRQVATAARFRLIPSEALPISSAATCGPRQSWHCRLRRHYHQGGAWNNSGLFGSRLR